MPTPDARQSVQQPDGGAVDWATDALSDAGHRPGFAERAFDLGRDAEEREDERHDEYDDPDQGGEA